MSRPAMPTQPGVVEALRKCRAFIFSALEADKTAWGIPDPDYERLLAEVDQALAHPEIAQPGPKQMQEQWPLRAVFGEMGTVADDPMWADHVELPKATLRRWVKTIRPYLTTLPHSPPAVGAHDPKRKHSQTINLTDQELDALEALAKEHELPPWRVLLQGLRLYQLQAHPVDLGPMLDPSLAPPAVVAEAEPVDNPLLPNVVLLDNQARAYKADGASGNMVIDTSVALAMIAEIMRARASPHVSRAGVVEDAQDAEVKS